MLRSSSILRRRRMRRSPNYEQKPGKYRRGTHSWNRISKAQKRLKLEGPPARMSWQCKGTLDMRHLSSSHSSNSRQRSGFGGLEGDLSLLMGFQVEFSVSSSENRSLSSVNSVSLWHMSHPISYLHRFWLVVRGFIQSGTQRPPHSPPSFFWAHPHSTNLRIFELLDRPRYSPLTRK